MFDVKIYTCFHTLTIKLLAFNALEGVVKLAEETNFEVAHEELHMPWWKAVRWGNRCGALHNAIRNLDANFYKGHGPCSFQKKTQVFHSSLIRVIEILARILSYLIFFDFLTCKDLSKSHWCLDSLNLFQWCWPTCTYNMLEGNIVQYISDIVGYTLVDWCLKKTFLCINPSPFNITFQGSQFICFALVFLCWIGHCASKLLLITRPRNAFGAFFANINFSVIYVGCWQWMSRSELLQSFCLLQSVSFFLVQDPLFSFSKVWVRPAWPEEKWTINNPPAFLNLEVRMKFLPCLVLSAFFFDFAPLPISHVALNFYARYVWSFAFCDLQWILSWSWR